MGLPLLCLSLFQERVAHRYPTPHPVRLELLSIVSSWQQVATFAPKSLGMHPLRTLLLAVVVVALQQCVLLLLLLLLDLLLKSDDAGCDIQQHVLSKGQIPPPSSNKHLRTRGVQ